LLIGTSNGKILKIQKFKIIGWKLTDVITLDEIKNEKIVDLQIMNSTTTSDSLVILARSESVISSIDIVTCTKYSNRQNCEK